MSDKRSIHKKIHISNTYFTKLIFQSISLVFEQYISILRKIQFPYIFLPNLQVDMPVDNFTSTLGQGGLL